MRIVVLGAFEDELTHIIPRFADLKELVISKCRCLSGKWNSHDIFIALTGVGTSSAAITTTILCEKLNPDLIIFCGVAGGLKSNQRIGDLVLATQIVDADLYSLPLLLKDTPYSKALIHPHTLKVFSAYYSCNSALEKIIDTFYFDGLQQGSIVTSNIFPAPKSVFEEIKKLNCSAIEMESAGIYHAVEHYDVPVITIRAISNLLDESGNDLGTEPEALTICSLRLASCLMQLLAHINSLSLIDKTMGDDVIQDLVQKYNLSRHPEGGWYKRTFQSNDYVIAKGEASLRYHGEARLAGTSIIYLLGQNDFSAWHKVQSDETWFFHQGDPLIIRILNHFGVLQSIKLGPDEGLLQFTIRAGEVFCAEALSQWSLVSCVVTPGFDFKDFHLLSREEFLTLFPQHKSLLKFVKQ